MTDTNNERDIARGVFERFGEIYLRGHEDFMVHARRLEDYYLGGGRQWKDEDRAVLEKEGRPCYEVNTVMPAINAAAGYQIANRVDISFVPRGGETDDKDAKLMSKVVRQSLDNAKWRSKETDVFLDGLIQQRGFLDMRMSYENSDLGELDIRVPDPLDCLPDPDAKSADPDDWSDYHESRWLTASQIECSYGKAASDLVVANSMIYCDSEDFGDEQGISRSSFSDKLPGFYRLNRGWYGRAGALRRYRIIEQQTNEYTMREVARWPTGDIRVIENMPPEFVNSLLEQGIPVFKRRMRQVHWNVCAPEVTLFNKTSPYDHITAIPFFPYFRRGRMVGMVDNQISVQDMLNKFLSQYAHVVNGSANSGWQGEANSLQNMDDEEFVNRGSETGLVLLRKPNTAPMQKIDPNKIPTGLDKMIDYAHSHTQIVSGMDENMLGLGKGDMSGVAIQSLQFAAQQKLAITLDNLSRTRQMVANRAREYVQKFMGAERVMRITEIDPYGRSQHVPTMLNQRDLESGRILNDLTIGTYDLILNEQPAQVTFDNSQFEQLKSMRKDMGIPIKDARVVRSSNLTDKSEIADELEQDAGRPDPVKEAEAKVKEAQAMKIANEAVAKSIEAQFSAVKTAREIVITPGVAPLADALLRSGGYQDKDAAPIVPNSPVMDLPPQPESTNPLTPSNPEAGLSNGLTATTE